MGRRSDANSGDPSAEVSPVVLRRQEIHQGPRQLRHPRRRRDKYCEHQAALLVRAPGAELAGGGSGHLGRVTPRADEEVIRIVCRLIVIRDANVWPNERGAKALGPPDS